jgi:hypothetical protein
MSEVMQYLSNWGVHVNISGGSDPMLLFFCCILVLSIVFLVSFIQVLLYFAVLYITDHKYIIDKISNYIVLVKIMNIYKHTSASYPLSFRISG